MSSIAVSLIPYKCNLLISIELYNVSNAFLR